MRPDATDRLYAAVKEWAEEHGGTVVVAGGVGIEPGARKFNYNVVISVTGKPPAPHREEGSDGRD